MSFTGFGEAALDFYDDLEVDNTKTFWEAHRAVYLEQVKAPITALTEALTSEFGAAKVFRPFRDVRFAKDKPYKTHQGAYVGVAPACGWYVEVSARGVRAGAGFYDADASNLARIRTAIDDEVRGTQLRRLLATLERSGFVVGGDRLKTVPRGYSADHPRIDLLRHRSLTVVKEYGFAPIIHTPELLGAVRDDWRATRPLVEWLAARLGG